MEEFRGLDYNKIKSEYVGKTKETLEEHVYLCAIKGNKAQQVNDLFSTIEYMARMALILEVLEELQN